MDQSSSVPVPPLLTNALVCSEKNCTNGLTEERDGKEGGKEWVTFDSNSNDNRKQAASETKSDPAIKHEQSVISVTTASSSSESGETVVVAVIQPSSSVQVSHDPLSDSVFHKLSPLSSPDKSKHQSNLLNEISSDTSIPIPESTTATTTTTTTTTGAAIPPSRPSTLPTTSKSFSECEGWLNYLRTNFFSFFCVSFFEIPENGQIIVTLLPVNTSCAWLTAAKFRPELVPEELMHASLTLTVEEYVQGMSILVNDHRFTMFNVLYKRIIFIWISMGFLFLISMLFSGARGVSLFVGGSFWLVMNAIGIFACMWIKFKLLQSLETCMQSVNAIFVKHKLLMGIDDRGHLSCHKINLFFIYFDTSHCVRFLNEMICQSLLNGNTQHAPGTSSGGRRADDITGIEVDDDVVIITAASDARRSQKVDRSEGRADRLILRYSQRWVKEFVRKRLDLRHRLHFTSAAVTLDSNWTELPPRHCIGSRCPCQFIEEHFKFKPLSRLTFQDLCG